MQLFVMKLSQLFRSSDGLTTEASDIGLKDWPRQMLLDREDGRSPVPLERSKIDRDEEGDLMCVTYSGDGATVVVFND